MFLNPKNFVLWTISRISLHQSLNMAGSFHSSAYLRSPWHGHLSYQLSVKDLLYLKTSIEFESLSETFVGPSSTIVLIFLWIPACLVGSLTNAVHHCHRPLHAFLSPAAGYTSHPEKNHVLGLRTQFADSVNVCRQSRPSYMSVGRNNGMP